MRVDDVIEGDGLRVLRRFGRFRHDLLRFAGQAPAREEREPMAFIMPPAAVARPGCSGSALRPDRSARGRSAEKRDWIQNLGTRFERDPEPQPPSPEVGPDWMSKQYVASDLGYRQQYARHLNLKALAAGSRAGSEDDEV